MAKNIELRQNNSTNQPKWFDILRNDIVIGYTFLRSGTTIWEISHDNPITVKVGSFEKAKEEIARKENISVQNIKVTEN